MRVIEPVRVDLIDYAKKLPPRAKVAALVKFMREGGVVPPVHLQREPGGRFTLLDGRHRLAAHRELARETIVAAYDRHTMCAMCGLSLGYADLCPHHHAVYGDSWAQGNKIWCNFVHRGVVPPRLPKSERDDDFFADSPVGA